MAEASLVAECTATSAESATAPSALRSKRNSCTSTRTSAVDEIAPLSLKTTQLGSR